MKFLAGLQNWPPAVVLKCSRSTSGYICLCASPRKWLHPMLKVVSGTCSAIGQRLSALCFSITSVLLLPVPASLFSVILSMLWAWPPFLCLFISPVPPGRVLSLDGLYKPSDSLAGPSLQTSVEVQDLSHLSCPLFCHFLDVSAVKGHLFPVPAIHSCELSSCLSNPVTAVNI